MIQWILQTDTIYLLQKVHTVACLWKKKQGLSQEFQRNDICSIFNTIVSIKYGTIFDCVKMKQYFISCIKKDKI